MSQTIVILTSKSKEEILALGGTAWWKLNSLKARNAKNVLLVHNAKDPKRTGDPEMHGRSFLLGTIRELRQDTDGRWLIQFATCADTDDGFRWPGNRNPVAYLDESEVARHIEVREWQDVPPVDFEVAQNMRRDRDASYARIDERRPHSTKNTPKPRTFADIVEFHRAELAEELGVSATKISITIAT